MISSVANPKVKYVRRLQADKRFRSREQRFVVEGTRWLAEVAQFLPSAAPVFYTAAWWADGENQRLLQHLTGRHYQVSDAVMAAMSDTETAPGVLAIVPQTPCPIPTAVTLLLILDGVADPGNLGTLLRTAAAAGVDAVLLGPGCVDAYNPKVVRASMGAHLRLPIHHLAWQVIAQQVAAMPVWLAAVDGETVYTAVAWREPAALIIGSEAHGASPEARQLATGRLTIPMRAQAESLNAAVAAAVILFEAARQRGKWPQPSK